MTRPSWHQYFQEMAYHAASRGTCPRRKVGCVLVRDRHAIATGYNGSLSGTIHCDPHGCQMEDGHCVRTVHAEANAVAQAAKRGASTNGATAYVTTFPCRTCLKLLIQAGVHAVFYGEEYPHPEEVLRTQDLASSAGVPLKQLTI